MDQTLLLVALAVLGFGLVRLALARRETSRVVGAFEALLADGPAAAPPVRLGDRRLDRVFHDLSERLSSVEQLASTDQLTGVLNRPASLRGLANEIERAGRYGRSLAVALVDIDHFKKVNDTYGHAAGDFVLHHVAQLLQANLRSTDVVGRYGGEEFLVVLPEGDVGAADAAEKLRRLVGKTPVVLPDDTELAVTISVGLATGSGSELQLDRITHDADSALYAAKAMGRDQVYVFRELDEQRVVQRSPLSAGARRAAMDAGEAAADAAQQQLAAILAPRPGWAGHPSSLIAELAVGLGDGLGLSTSELARIRTASLLHDVGKIAIPESLLSKRAALTAEEWRMIREHPKTGHMVLEQAGALREAATIALHHHEWFNGRGYPNGLAGGDIPVGARIVAIADAYEAMTTWRPYKRTKSPAQAIEELRRCAGTQFDPALVDLFVAHFADALIAQGSGELTEATG